MAAKPNFVSAIVAPGRQVDTADAAGPKTYGPGELIELSQAEFDRLSELGFVTSPVTDPVQ